MGKHKMIGCILTGLVISIGAGGQYIYEILEYVPAPGQHINGPAGTSAAAQSITGTTTGLLSLGAFGGYITFRFEDPVPNDPENPYGVDFTIFGNSVGSWSEPGIVSVMKDVNRNGLADDTWFELAGSEYHSAETNHQYIVTYTNPGGTEAADVYWEDNMAGSGYIFANSIHTQSYYPDPASFPGIPDTQYSLGGSRIYSGIDSSDNMLIHSPPLAYGYADNHMRGEAPFTIPDNPGTPEIEGAGGDPMDISWAVDKDGMAVFLDTIHFVKVHTAVNGNAGALGEISTEISGAAIVDRTLSGRPEIAAMHRNQTCKVYPNPVEDRLYISGEKPATCRLLNISGEVIYKMDFMGDTKALDMSGYIPGIYFIQILNEYEVFTDKLIKR